MWYLTVSAVTATEYTIAASIKTAAVTGAEVEVAEDPNPALYGTVETYVMTHTD